MSRRRNNTSRNRNTDGTDEADGFQPLQTEDGFVDAQFYRMHPPFPLKTAFCVMTFLILGSACLVCSALITFGHFGSPFGDRAGPLFICGLLLFIPGAYFTSIMLRTCLNPNGQHLGDVLPEF